MRDMPVVAGCARDRNAGLSALLCEGGCRAGGVHGAERTAEDTCHGLPQMDEVGEVVMDAKKPFGGGVIMPHVVSPDVAGGEVQTPRIVQEFADLERGRIGEERERTLDRRFQERIEEFYAKALPLVQNRRIQVRQLQRMFGIGYRHACQIVLLLEERGIIDRL